MKLKIRLEDWNGISVMQVLECDEGCERIRHVRVKLNQVGKIGIIRDTIKYIVSAISEDFKKIAKEKGLLEEYTPELEFGVEVRKINSTNRWFYICEHEGVYYISDKRIRDFSCEDTRTIVLQYKPEPLTIKKEVKFTQNGNIYTWEVL